MNKLLLSGVALGMLAFSGAAQAQIKLGVAGPITGPNAAFGAQLKNGVEQAVEDINAAGGIMGQKIVVSVGDDVSDPKQGVSVANKFSADGIKWVLGHFNSGVTMPASEVYAENGMIFITPSATNPKITERGLWNAFRTCGRDDQQGAVAAEYIVKNMKDKKVAVVHDKTTYGQGLADETKKAMKQILTDIQTGEYAKSFILENRAGAPTLLSRRRLTSEHSIEVVGDKLRAMMPWIKASKLVDRSRN